MKHLGVAILAVGGITAALVLALFLFSGNGPQGGNDAQWIDIGQTVTPDGSQNTVPASTGNVRYDLTINYVNGEKKVFSQVISLPSFPTGSVIQDGKDVKSIDLEAHAKLFVPASVSGLGPTVYTESKVSAYLDQQLIDSPAVTGRFFAIKTGENPEMDLYKISIPASKINVSSGTYSLNFVSTDQIKFVVNGQDRIMKVNAGPKLTFQKDGSDTKLQVVTYSPAAMADLSPTPVYVDQGTSKPLVGYRWTAVLKATGFKPISPATVTYKYSGGEEQGFDLRTKEASAFLQGQSLRTVSKTTDLSGSFRDEYQLKAGDNWYIQYSTPQCDTYYADISITDGQNNASIKSGCTYKQANNLP